MTFEPTAAGQKQARTRRPAPWQWNLRTLFLLTAAVAAWLTFFHYFDAVPRLKQQVHLMRQVAPELIVEDSQQIAVLKLPQTWRNDHRWDIYLPDGQYWLRLATREIDKSGLAPVVGEAKLGAGRHRIQLQLSDNKREPKLAILIDGRLTVDVREESDWGRLGGYSWGQGSALAPDEPAVLLHGDCGQKHPGTSFLKFPGNGLLLWIERAAP